MRVLVTAGALFVVAMFACAEVWACERWKDVIEVQRMRRFTQSIVREAQKKT